MVSVVRSLVKSWTVSALFVLVVAGAATESLAANAEEANAELVAELAASLVYGDRKRRAAGG